MNQDEKLEKVCNEFSKLNDEQQDYILGILQALVFAKTTGCSESVGTKLESSD
ncbi:MAG: hypothetical protein FWD47_05155 [Treponema sp.]|nr:hypothetical protein [Treponema sp.]